MEECKEEIGVDSEGCTCGGGYPHCCYLEKNHSGLHYCDECGYEWGNLTEREKGIAIVKNKAANIWDDMTSEEKEQFGVNGG